MLAGLPAERPSCSVTAGLRRRSAKRCQQARTLRPAGRVAAGGGRRATSSSTRPRSGTRCSSSSAPGRRSSTFPTRRPPLRRPPASGERTVVDGLEVLVAQGAASFELWTGVPAPVEVDAARRRLVVVTLELTTAGESHGPALVANSHRPARGARPRAGADRRGPRAAPAGLRAQSSPAARAGPGRRACRAFGTGERSGRRSHSSSRTATTRTGSGG